MKFTAHLHLITSYVQAGNTGQYTYDLAEKTFTVLAKDLWQLRAITALLATSAKSIVATSVSIGAGAPPAANTRTVAITAAGVCSFADANEALLNLELKVTISDCEDHPYEIMSQMIPAYDLVGTLQGWNGTAVVTVSEEEWISNDSFIADGAYSYFCHTFTGTGITDKKLKPISLVFAETDLVTREYTGQYAELAMKGIVTVGQIAKKHYEGVAAQIANYVGSGASPLALELRLSEHTFRIGEGI